MKDFLKSLKEKGYKYCIIGDKYAYFSTKYWNTKAFWDDKYIIIVSEEPFTVKVRKLDDDMSGYSDEEQAITIDEAIKMEEEKEVDKK